MCCAGVCHYARLQSLSAAVRVAGLQGCFGGLLDRVKRSKLFRLIQGSPIAVRSRIHGVQAGRLDFDLEVKRVRPRTVFMV